VYRLGDKVRVQVVRVDLDLRQTHLALVDILERVREGEHGARHSRAHAKREVGQRKSRPGRRERMKRRR